MSGICFAIIHLSPDQGEKPYFSMTSLTSRRIRESYLRVLTGGVRL